MANPFNPSNDVFSKPSPQPAGIYKTPTGLKSIDPSKVKGKVSGTYYGGGYVPPQPTIQAELPAVEQAKLETLKQEVQASKTSGKGIKDVKLIEYQRLQNKQFQLASGTYGMSNVGEAYKKDVAYAKQVETYNKNIEQYPQYTTLYQTRGIIVEQPKDKTSPLIFPFSFKDNEIRLINIPRLQQSIPYKIIAGDIGEKLIRVNVPTFNLKNYMFGTPVSEVKEKLSSISNNVYYQAGLSFIPTTPLQVGEAYAIGKAFQLAPVVTESAFTGLGTFQYVTAKTPIEKAQAIEMIALPYIAKGVEYAGRRTSLKVDLKSFEKQLRIENPEAYKIYKREYAETSKITNIKTPVKEIDLSRLKLLENYPQTQLKLIDYFKYAKNEGVLGGSISQETQMLKNIQTRRPGDIDYYIFRTEKSGAMLRDIKNILKEDISNVRIRGEKIVIGKEKFLEIHPYETYLRPNIEQVFPVYKPSSFGIIKTPGGIQILKLNVQARRKLVGGYLEKYSELKSGSSIEVATSKATARRLKDIPTYFKIKESYLTIEKLIKLPESKIKLLPESKIAKLGSDIFKTNIDKIVSKDIKNIKITPNKKVNDVSKIISDYPSYTKRASLSYSRYIPKKVELTYPISKYKTESSYPSFTPTKYPSKLIVPTKINIKNSYPSFTPTKYPSKLIVPIKTPMKDIIKIPSKEEGRKIFKLGEGNLIAKKVKEQKIKYKYGTVLSEGFISKILGRKPKTFKLKDIGKAVKYYSSPFSLREAPRIVR
jgi:hypothetical protein